MKVSDLQTMIATMNKNRGIEKSNWGEATRFQISVISYWYAKEMMSFSYCKHYIKYGQCVPLPKTVLCNLLSEM